MGWVRLCLSLTAFLLATTVLLALLGLVWLDSDRGHRWLAREISTTLDTDDMDIELSALDGSIFETVRFRGLAVSDSQGRWLGVNSGIVHWSPLGLLDGDVQVGQVILEGLTLDRLPEATSESGSPSATVSWIPDRVLIRRGQVTGTVLSTPLDAELNGLMLARANSKGQFGLVSGETDWLTLNVHQVGQGPVMISGELDFEEGSTFAELAGLPSETKLGGRFDLEVGRNVAGAGYTAAWRTNIDEFHMPGSSTSGLSLSGQARKSGHIIQGEFHLEAARLASGDQEINGLVASADFETRSDASWRIADGSVVTDFASVTGLSVAGDAAIIEFAAGNLKANERVARFFDSADNSVRGLEAGFLLKRLENNQYNLATSGKVKLAKGVAEALTSALGQEPSFSVNVDVADNLDLVVHSASSTLPIGDLSVTGQASLASLSGDLEVVMAFSPDAVDQHSGSALAGSITLLADISGDLASPSFSLTSMPIEFAGYGVELSELQARLHLTPDSKADTSWLGSLNISALSGQGIIKISSPVAAGQSGIHLGNLTVDSPLLAALGDVDYQTVSGVTGNLQLARSLDHLRTGSPDLEGVVFAKFSSGPDFTSHDISVRGEKLVFDTGDPFPLTIGRFDAWLTYRGESSSLETGMKLSQVAQGARSLERLDVLPVVGLVETWAIKSEGVWPFAVGTDLLVSRRGQQVDIQGQANIGAVDIKTDNPIIVSFDEGLKIELEDTSVGTGRLSLSAFVSDGQVTQLQAQAEGFDESILGILRPGLVDRAALDLGIDLQEQDGVLRGQIKANASGIVFPAGLSLETASTYGASIDVDLGAQGLMLTGHVTADSMEIGNLAARLPLALPADLDGLVSNNQDPVDLRLFWGGDIEPVWALMQRPRHSLSGQLTGVLEVGGTIEAPVYAGTLVVEGGRYEYIPLGLTADIGIFKMRGDNQSLSLDQFEASDGDTGRLDASGRFNLTNDQRVEGGLDLKMSDFRIARLPTFTGKANADLSWRLDPEASTLSGIVEARRLDIRLPDRIPVTIEEIEVTEINGENLSWETGQSLEGFDLGSGPPTLLNLALKMPGQGFVEGYGLKSEWRGELKVGGTTLDPQVSGQLELIRGDYTLGPRQFNLARGKLMLDGNRDLDPLVSLRAVHETPAMTANLDITGRASSPKFTFSSIPAMPQDEILARILVGKSSTELSAWQLAELGSMVASLRGGGNDPVSKIRRSLGLDTLSVGKQDGLEGQTLLTGGKYLRRNIYLEVETALAGNTAASRVRFDLTRRLQLETEAGPLKGNSLFLKWFWDY